MKNHTKALSENRVKVIKISKTALFEFIDETFIEGQECFLDVDSLDVMNLFDVNFERGAFIFCVYKAEDDKGAIAQFPKEIDLQQFLTTIPDATSTMYADGRYKEYTKEELIALSKKQ